jgi:HD-like signal output (HDOD) protein
MRHILFVDDDAASRNGYAMLCTHQPEAWQVHFALSADQAWTRLQQQPMDALVVALSSAQETARLIGRVMGRSPDTIRIVLAAETDRDSVLRMLGPAHQYLTKPCPREAFGHTLTRSLALRDLLAHEQLRRVVTQLQGLPSIPALYLELLNVLGAEDPSVERIAEIMARDLGMCTKMLQLVNSAFFGLARDLSNPEEAVMYLGLDTIKALVLSLQIFALFERVKVAGFSYETLWTHCWQTGVLAKRLAGLEGLQAHQMDQAFTAGLLHDVGKLILATSMPTAYQDVLRLQMKQQIPLWQAEQNHFGVSHAEVGGYLLSLWGLPSGLVEIVAWHHRPLDAREERFSPLTAIHVANAFEHEAHPAFPGLTDASLDLSYVSRVVVGDRLGAWRAACQLEGAEQPQGG